MAKAVIDQIYDKLNELFGVQNQLFCMEFPGRVLDESTYSYKTDSVYSILMKPQPVLEEEFRLSNDLFDVAQITGGPNGSKLSDTFNLALNNLLPKFINIPQFDNDKAKMRDWLLEVVETEVNGQTVKCSRMQLYEMLNNMYLQAKQDWDNEKTQKLETVEKATNRLEALEDYSKWLAEIAPVKEAELENYFSDSVVRGYYHEIRNILGYLDVATESEQLEVTKARMRNSSMSSLDESTTIYPVQFQPTDWFKGLSTDFKPIDLLLSPDFIEDQLLSKQRTLSDLQAQYQKLAAAPTGNIDDLKKQVSQAQTAYDTAQTNMIENFSNVTITLLQMYFAQKSQDGGSPLKDEFNANLKKKNEPPLTDAQWTQISDMQNKTIQAQANLNSTSRALASLQAAEAAAEATDTQQQLIILKSQITSLQADIESLKTVLMSQFSNNKGNSASYALSQSAIDDLKTKSTITANGATKLAALIGKNYNSTDDFTTDVKAALGTDWTQVIQDALNTVSLQVHMLPSEMPAAGQFFDIVMSFESSNQYDTSKLSSGSEHTSWSVDVLFGSAGGSSDKSWSDFTSKHTAKNSNFQIGMRATKVTIDRGGWFNPEVFKATANMFHLDNNNKISLGFPATINKPTDDECRSLNTALFPCFPVSFVIVKDVTFKIQISADDVEVANHVLNQNSSVGGGFLCFSASSASSSSSSSQSYYSNASGTNLIIKIPGPQILGWYLQFLPSDNSTDYSAMPDNYLPKDQLKAMNVTMGNEPFVDNVELAGAVKKAILVAHGEGGMGTFSIPKVTTITPSNTALTFAKAKEYMGSSKAYPEYSSTSFGEFGGLSDDDCRSLFGQVIAGSGIVSTGKRRGGDMAGSLIYALRGNDINADDITKFITDNNITSLVLLACRS